ncbi:MAG: hypothetical protein HYS21_03745 [Deltaproteobacteria bacterium]|nr:hypothetical protein [Deltaproteobacteria bacterium]
MEILFLAKHKPYSEDAAELVRMHAEGSEIVFGQRGDLLPQHLKERKFDYVISYISPWIVPEEVLKNAKIAAINFHPGPPEYPGIGCTNFAVYNGEREFGITVHHMERKVDTGKIIHVERFPVFDRDTVYTVTQRCYAYIYPAFVRIFRIMLSGEPMPQSSEQWKRKPYTRKELDELCRVTKDMADDEIKRRVKATDYPGMPGAYLESGGEIYPLKLP